MEGDTHMAISELVQSLKGKLIVSVQAYPGEPLRTPEFMAAMARACELGGAAAIRCQGLSDISAIKGRVEVPVIGLWKEGHEGVYITPTLESAVACADAGADIVALDATGRERPDGRSFEETVRELAGVPVVCEGHVHTPADAAAAIAAGAWAVVVGTAITHPTSITRWFCEAVRYAG